uniref:C2H2-type domain-containing protein n=1 Tax=Panagrolaimus sp. JU765 TaxID=591449 RepID=A0AC34QMN1_9BILA
MSLLPNGEDEQQFIGQEFLDQNVYIANIEDDGNFVMNSGYDPPGSVFEHAANDNSAYYVSNCSEAPADGFDNGLSLQPPTLDVMENEGSYQMVYGNGQYGYDMINHSEVGCPIEESDDAQGTSYLLSQIPTVYLDGVEGKLTDESGQILQFLDAENQPIVYISELPPGVQFTPLNNSAMLLETQYIDEYGVPIEPTMVEEEISSKDESYYFVDEFGNELILEDSANTLQDGSETRYPNSSSYDCQPPVKRFCSTVEKDEVESLVCEECAAVFKHDQYSEYIKHVDICVIDGICKAFMQSGTTSFNCDADIFPESSLTDSTLDTDSQKSSSLVPSCDVLDNSKIECPCCGLILFKHNFRTHYRIHSGELPFDCPTCKRKFRTTSALKVHVRSHTGERPYSCLLCSYATITKRNLDRHVFNNHVKESS